MKPTVRVFETEDESLWAKLEDEINSQQGSSSEDGVILMARPSDRAGSSAGARPSGALLAAEEVEIEELGLVKSCGEGQVVRGNLVELSGGTHTYQ